MCRTGPVRLLIVAVLCLHDSDVSRADTFTWMGPNTGLWSVPANWQGGVAPVSSNTTRVEFYSTNAPVVTTNDLPSDTVVNSLLTTVLSTNGIDLETVSGSPRRLRFAGIAPSITSTGTNNAAQLAILMPLRLDTDTSISNVGGLNLLNLLRDVDGTGPLRVAAGRIIVGGPAILRPTNGTVVELGGELWVSDQTLLNVTTPVTVQSGGAVSMTPNARVNAPLRLAGQGTSFSKSGALHTERTTLSGGIANARWDGLIMLDAAATIATRDGTLTLTGGINLNGNALTSCDPVNGTGTVRVQTAGVSGTGSVTVNGGRLELLTASAFTGPVAVQSNGTLRITAETGLGTAANSLTLDNGTLDLGSSLTLGGSRSVILGSGNGTFLPNNNSITVNSIVSGPGKLKTSTGTLTLNGANTYGGGLEITSGTVQLPGDAGLGAAGGSVTLNNGSLSLIGSFNISPSRSVAVNGNSTLGFKFDSIVGSPISGPGTLHVIRRFDAVGLPVITLTASNTQAGLKISQSIVRASSADNLGNPAGTLELTTLSSQRGRLELLAPFNLGPLGTNIYDGDINTSNHNLTITRPGDWKSLSKFGSGILTLSASNNLLIQPSLSQLRVAGGVVQAGAAGAIPSGINVQLEDGGQVDLNGFDQTLRRFSPGNGSVKLDGATLRVEFGGFGNSIEQGLIGPGALVLRAAELTLYGACSQTNTTVGTTNNDSTIPSLTIDSNAALGAPGAPVTLRNGGRLETTITNIPVVVDASHPLAIDNGCSFRPHTDLVIESVVTGFGPVMVNNASGALELRNPSNAFTGTISVIGSTLRVSRDDALGAATNEIHLGDVFFDGETFQVTGGTLQAGTNATLPSTRSIRLHGRSSDQDLNAIDTQEFTFTIDGNITELDAGGNLVKRGSGTLRLNGTNSITDRLTVEAGTLGGTGTIQDVQLLAGTTLAPGNSIGTFRATTVEWQDGAQMAFELGGAGACDRLEVSGTLNGDTDTPRQFAFSGTPALMTYTLVTGAGGGNLATDFEAEDFTFTGPAGLSGTFTLDSAGLKFTVTSLPGGGGDSDGDGLPDDWELAHFGNLTQTAAGDPDGDGQSNGLEYAAGTDPNNAASRFTFELLSVTPSGTTLFFTPSQTNRVYALEFSTAITPASWQVVSNALFTPLTNGQSVFDPSAVSTQRFYRMNIQAP